MEQTTMTSAYYTEQIAYHQSIIDDLQAKYEVAKAKEDEAAKKVEADANALAAFDGLKLVADPDNPLSLAVPQRVYANLIYNVHDGIKNVRYVCVAGGIYDGTNLAELFEPYEI